jgi:hypothetical protein
VRAGIRFVLNDAFAGVGPEERQKLLHVRLLRAAGGVSCKTGAFEAKCQRASAPPLEQLLTPWLLRVHAVLCGVLQEGAGHAVVSAYVEIVIDNSDGRFPVRPRVGGPECCCVAGRRSGISTGVLLGQSAHRPAPCPACHAVVVTD